MVTMTYLIVGATGAVGSSLLMRIRESGHRVHAISRNLEKFEKLAATQGITYSVADILQTREFCEAIHKAGVELIRTR